MVTLIISEGRKQINTMDDQLRDKRVIVVTRHGKPAFALVDLEYLICLGDTMEILSNPEAMNMLQDSIADIRAGRLHDHEDVKRELL